MMESEDNLKETRPATLSWFDNDPYFFHARGNNSPERIEFRAIDIPGLHIIKKGSVADKIYAKLGDLDFEDELFKMPGI
jgi:hypothetical protein